MQYAGFVTYFIRVLSSQSLSIEVVIQLTVTIYNGLVMLM